MIIRLEKASGIPLTRQILDQIRTQYATGALQSGDQLPSVRQLALDLAVNQNTILRVYERLEAEGLLERRHGSGTFVANGARANPLRREQEKLRLEAEQIVRHARALGIGAGELLDIVAELYGKESTESRERERREEE